METNLTDITILLDRTGSMQSIKDDVIGGFNNFVCKQQEVESACVLSLIQFDTQEPHEVVHNTIPVADVAQLTDATYVPRGGTPLRKGTGAFEYTQSTPPFS